MKKLLSIFSLTLFLLAGYSMLNEAPAPEPGMGRGNDFSSGQGGSNSGPGSESSSNRSSTYAGVRSGWYGTTQVDRDRNQWGRMQSSREPGAVAGGTRASGNGMDKPGSQCFTC